jgi:hypothetical protein
MGKLYVVTVPHGKKASCVSGPLSGTIPIENFSNYTFERSFDLAGETVDVWFRKEANETVKYLDYQTTEDPLEFSSETTRMLFLHYRGVPPPASEFAIPATCNHMSETTPILGCSTWDKIKCGAIIAACAAACCAGGCVVDPACIGCLGDAYETCKSCF